MSRLNIVAADLTTGDRLLRLGGVGFAQFRDPDADPVLVADVRPPLDDDPADASAEEQIIEILTSTGVLYTRVSAPVLIDRDDVVTAETILLISRRQSLHARLTKLGSPVIRRTPVTAASVPAVTEAEWNTAPLIVIDGYLAQATIRSMWARGDLRDRDQIVMVGTDPDDYRLDGRQIAAHARMLSVFPYDEAALRELFQAATRPECPSDPYLGILTPRA